jgi:hypothetical protein
MENNNLNGTEAPSVQKNEQLTTTDRSQEQYLWITNDGLLRDEGTLYGIANADKIAKTEAIKEYYNTRTTSFQEQKAFLERTHQEIEDRVQAIPADIERLKAEFVGENKALRQLHHLLPIAFQLLCYVSVCSFNYFLLQYWLNPVLVSTLICLGLYSFGLFSVFIGRSILYNPTESIAESKEGYSGREKWKLYLEEFGVPSIVALFICILPFRAYPVEYSLVAFLFFFLLFLFGGKGLVNTLFRLRTEFTSYAKGRKLKRQFQSKETSLLEMKKELEEKLLSIEEQIKAPTIELNKLIAERDYKINLFNSEYNLASEGRNALTKSQIMQFS